MIRVAAHSLSGIPAGVKGDYAAALTAKFAKMEAELVVLPAHTSFFLYAGEDAARRKNFKSWFRSFMEESPGWNEQFLRIHSDLARENNFFLVAGTVVEEEGGRYFQTAYCFGPDGKICSRQRQTHLSREERAFGLSRGDELHFFDMKGMRTGLIVGTDARHPEVGRIMALQGVDLVAHCGALTAVPGSAAQLGGIWAQVQQNQFWGIEAQLRGVIGNRLFGAQCAVIGPCEITSGLTGYLDRESAGKPYALAELHEAERSRIKGDYPLLDLLHPEAYQGLLPELYG